jgi:tetratricopeptide (TPR) repeat protein
MKHSVPALVTFVVLGVAGCNRTPVTQPAASSPVPSACTIALAPGSQRDDRDREIAHIQDEARGGTRARLAIERLGYLYVARARVRNDAGDYKLAEATADCFESRFPGENAALLLRGHVFHQLHRFRDAEQVARTLVARRSMVLDHGLLGDALMEQGRLSEAAVAYQAMLDLKPFYQSYTRAAHLRWLKGDLDGAIAVMQKAIAAASPRDPESSAWAWTRMSAYQLQAGRVKDATDAVESALHIQPDYAAALLAKGRLLIATRRAGDAIEVLRRAARLNPLPEYQWILADALRQQGLDEEATAIERALAATGATADPRTFALYLATRRIELAEAVALAEEELVVRGDIFTLDAHAWTLAANGRIEEARAAITRAVAEGTQDGRLFFHAGAINAAAGRDVEARRWLKKADHLRAMLLPSESAELDKYLSTTN